MSRLRNMRTIDVVELAYKGKAIYGNKSALKTLRGFVDTPYDEFTHSIVLDSKETLSNLRPNNNIQEILNFFDNEKEAKQVIFKEVIEYAKQLQEKYTELLTKEEAKDE